MHKKHTLKELFRGELGEKKAKNCPFQLDYYATGTVAMTHELNFGQWKFSGSKRRSHSRVMNKHECVCAIFVLYSTNLIKVKDHMYSWYAHTIAVAGVAVGSAFLCVSSTFSMLPSCGRKLASDIMKWPHIFVFFISFSFIFIGPHSRCGVRLLFHSLNVTASRRVSMIESTKIHLQNNYLRNKLCVPADEVISDRFRENSHTILLILVQTEAFHRQNASNQPLNMHRAWTTRRLLAYSTFGGGAALTAVSLYANDCDVNSIGVVRLSRAASAVFGVGRLYYDSLYRHEWDKQSAEYKLEMSRVHRLAAEKLLKLICTNKGVYIKVGQHIGSLDYLLPKEYVNTMKVLHSNAPRNPIGDLYRVIREDLKVNVSYNFTYHR